jgi:early growth response protein 1
MRLQAPFFSDDLFSAPLLLDAQTILESEFQSNSIVTHISRPAASYPSLNGLGFHYPAPSSFFKQEDFLDQEVVPLSAPVTSFERSVTPSSGEQPLRSVATLPADLDVSDEDPFIEVYRLLNSVEASLSFCASNGPTLQYPDRQSSWSLSHSSTAPQSADEETLKTTFWPNLSKRPLSQVVDDFDLVPSNSHGPAILGPFPDINMFDMACMNHVPDVGVNPADIMRPLSVASSICITDRSASPPSSLLVSDSPTSTERLPSAEVLSTIVAMLSNTAKNENVSQTEIFPVPQSTADTVGGSGIFHHLEARVMDEFAARTEISRPKGSNESPFGYQLPTPTAAAHRSPLLSLPFQTNQQAAFTSVLDCGSLDSPNSPVLNAHLGIELSELVDRADKYRARFPGRAIDKKWLMAYAGKLTKRGELLEDYRCYVNGCTQKNKRRDHILVHVGAHVDQRLFVCNVW